MSRNYGIGQRDLSQAGYRFLQKSVQNKHLSHESVSALSDRFSKFAAYAKENGIGRLERITPALLQQYGKELAQQVRAGATSAAYAQCLVSAVNTVMQLTPANWHSVAPVKDCGIEQRSHIRDTPVQTNREPLAAALNQIKGDPDGRLAAIAVLARELGLRSKEASLLNAKSALAEAQSKGFIGVSEGTKGGRYRQVPITSEKQLVGLIRASQAQSNSTSLVPDGKTWAQFRSTDLQNLRIALQENGFAGIHDLRAAYAADRYQQLTGQPAPVNGGNVASSQDLAAREVISNELGHGRIDVVSSYVGGR